MRQIRMRQIIQDKVPAKGIRDVAFRIIYKIRKVASYSDNFLYGNVVAIFFYTSDLLLAGAILFKNSYAHCCTLFAVPCNRVYTYVCRDQ